ncbi:CRISPR-associated helicase/endonuclease Cas3 [Pseudoalteromonas sp. SG43-7]|uniref:CRISPR-associated helicase/endonuclease Cas3 n=2 Tax=Pseudoalteromonas TaxID=53246 RepID=UPI001601AE5D|nr:MULTISPECIES: CRISPR-associated helicase/endonuclease Cas3 [unclassified Pseudoalteromonas]MBB1422217.1 CRISPR-associated helicase/endonuclease Cas3 [Pseudoalteromonas sp. SG43-7]MBB1480356.1 CRISPR-associated helicase/endonuclease Cas3 [Pseudoalteromonas sp. SG41-2]MBB1504394.1 CRISPR-associated helicase/endonuclease Cas3 [Pseudoalteromonas sp. SG41-1]
MSIPSYFKYWGKAKKDPLQSGADYHLLPYHCLDVAAVADIWLTESRTLLKQIAIQINCLESDAKAIILFYVLLHDLGKFDARFQNYVEEIRVQLQGEEFEVEPEKYAHGSHGYLHFMKSYGHNEAMKAVAGHHGYCDTSIDRNLAEPDADEELVELDKVARKEWIEFCLAWTGLTEIPDIGDIPMLAGLCSVADWIGSSITSFKTKVEDLNEYYQCTLPRAKQALIEAGVLNKLNGAGFEYLFSPYQPRGIQTLLNDMPLETGLTIVESDTGSGKTEFALAYASMLIEKNLADGIVFGLPTQATANGLFERIGEAASKLFPDSTLTLAHSKSKYLIPDENGFLHQSSKRAFLGSLSVATVDQILMGVLGIKHQFIRSFGTRKSVLILDEIHSFDAYMYALIERVLQGQHQAYSSVILLSATLPLSLKTKLVKPYSGKVSSIEYPLVTHVGMDGKTQEIDLKQPIARKKVYLENWLSNDLLPTAEQQQSLIEHAKNGAVIGVICNTVHDAQNLYQQLKSQINTEDEPLEIDLLHARYTFSDRARIEKQILDIYGKHAGRQGRILVATQVVEQSLDLDFDLLVSQIAPIEFLMQRMGRLWRHDRINTELSPRSTRIKQPTFITLLPDQPISSWKTHYQGSGFVYRNIRVLYRTNQYLNKNSKLTFPDCYRDAIEYVHNEQAYTEEPEELLSLFESYQQEQDGSAYTAKMYSVLDSKPLNDVDPRCALLTREGEMTATVVLLNEQGELWHGGDYQEQQDRELSTVAIAKKHAKGKQDPDLYCVKAIVNHDINYSELGVFLPLKNE